METIKPIHVFLRRMHRLRTGEKSNEMWQDSEIAQISTVQVIPGTSWHFWGRIPRTGNLCWYGNLADIS